jgi:RNA polymerase sigma-70 factor (ECF subfamily)
MDPDAADDDLLAAVAGGDERAFSRLVARHGPRIHALARRHFGSGADADDVAQEVFWRVWRHAGKWQPGTAQFSTWLYRVAVNLCLDRRRRGSPASVDDMPDIADPGADAEQSLGARQALAMTYALIAELPDRQRMALLLSVHDELSNAQIAAAMDLSEGAVEQLLVRARRSLRDASRGMR